ncbi:hypothetical protein IWQ62_005003 [Dispira parvispora]|uniref:NADH dehydrogenase [ubiquinone] 1 alpha subcomplex subunit n=1 Tax=Dispira parvispora TaxID=1520584 RepID=A0A9W8ART8_9FUNG|nr:hypothetical protein IWQ62_005003 [Dispira parvispora]
MSLYRAVKNIIKAGPRESFRQIMRLDEVKCGTLVGTDRYGNQYYENLKEKFLRDRWVVLARSDYDASQIPAEWHQWLHKMNDKDPNQTTPRPYRWIMPKHVENLTGTSQAYQPYNTTTPKVSSWVPEVKARGF